MTDSQTVKVAVRVRPFSEREKKAGKQLIVAMDGKTTLLVNPEKPKEKPREFHFDHSYWSHDGYELDGRGYCKPKNAKYIDQIKLFNDLGLGMLANAWKGYNSTIFAYGQTGSGKSYSIMGHGENKGLVPRLCEELFKEIEKKAKPGAVQFKVTFSMLEIYNEQVRDLLNKKKSPPHGLKVKERPGKGFHVEGLSEVPVGTFNEIRARISEGDKMRTIASTKMNDTSSRAHTIVKVHFQQNMIKEKRTILSNINMVDLAGSERAKQTEATGDRFEEAKNINKSLMVLGTVIKGLCDKAKGNKNAIVPFRDAILTKLLQNSLGGNSKTCMVAAISPDAENYEQTLSTLRYADRAKSIKTAAKVNETATDKLIKELIAEKQKLLQELEKAKGGSADGLSAEEIQRLKAEQEDEIARYKEQMEDMEKSWQKRLQEAKKEVEEIVAKEKQAAAQEKTIPHFSNLNEDPALCGKLVHMLKPGTSKLGNGKDSKNPDIVLNGLRIVAEHAVIMSKKDELKLRAEHGLILHNGIELSRNDEVTLNHLDRVRFGSNNLFVFVHPKQAEAMKKAGKAFLDVTYEYAQNEIAKHSGLNLDSEDMILQEEVMSIMQLVYDVNGMAEDMEKPAEFAIVLVSAEARGLDKGRTEVFVKLRDLDSGNEFLWDRNVFLNRQVHMQDMYREFEEKDEVPDVPKEKDPFWEPPETEVIVGVVSVPLNFLSHMVDFQDDPLTLIDYHAKQIGFVKVDLMPCNSKGQEDDDMIVDDPMDLVAKAMQFKIKIHQAMNIPERYIKTWCKYRFYDERDFTRTNLVSGNNPEYRHERLVKLKKDQVTHQFIEYLKEKSLPIEIWGQQRGRVGSATSSKAARERREDKQKLKDELDLWRNKSQNQSDILSQIQRVVDKAPKSKEMDKIRKLLEGNP